MRKQVLLVAVAILLTTQASAQMSNQECMYVNTGTDKKIDDHFFDVIGTEGMSDYSTKSGLDYSSFTRDQGFVIRPELYRGLFVNFGYQINPYIQTFACFGYGDGIEGGIGARVYTGDADWVAMFDLRFSLTDFSYPGGALVAGASYKDLDFGAGAKYYTDGYYYVIVPVLTVGWNIRCYEHR